MTEKDFKSIDEQIAILRGRGLTIIDEADDSLVEHMMAKERELEESCMQDIDDDMIVEQFYLK